MTTPETIRRTETAAGGEREESAASLLRGAGMPGIILGLSLALSGAAVPAMIGTDMASLYGMSPVFGGVVMGLAGLGAMIILASITAALTGVLLTGVDAVLVRVHHDGHRR